MYVIYCDSIVLLFYFVFYCCILYCNNNSFNSNYVLFLTNYCNLINISCLILEYDVVFKKAIFFGFFFTITIQFNVGVSLIGV